MTEATEVVVVDSIDWLVVSSTHIALAEVESVRSRTTPATPFGEELELQTVQVRKGHPPSRVTIPSDKAMPSAARAPQLLVFFDSEESPKGLIALDAGDAGNTPAITTTFQVLQTRAEILAALDQRLHRIGLRSKAEVDSVRLSIPAGSEADLFLGADGAYDLLVPADREIGNALLAQTAPQEDVWTRARAARQLGAFRDAESIQRLIELLQDPGTATVTTVSGGQTIEKQAYPARQAAYDALLASGVPVATPDGYLETFPRGLLTARGVLLQR